MAVAGGLDLHRGQLTFDYVDTGTGESWRGRISPADRESLRGWLRRFHGVPDVEFAVEGCTGWRYVVEELQRAGITPHLAEPAETAGLRGRKRRAKTDWADARHLRDLLLDGPDTGVVDPAGSRAGGPRPGAVVQGSAGRADELAAAGARHAVSSGHPGGAQARHRGRAAAPGCGRD